MNDRANRYNQYQPNRNSRYPRNQNFGNRDRDNDAKEDGLSFAHSWKQSTVEMAAAGAIVLGAVGYGVNGRAGGITNAGKGAIKATLRGFEQYLDRRAHPALKIIKNVGKRTFGTLQRMPGVPKPIEGSYGNALSAAVGDVARAVDENAVTTLAKQKYDLARSDALRAYKEQRGTEHGFDYQGTLDFFKEQARTELRQQGAQQSKSPVFASFLPPKKDKSAPGQPGDAAGSGNKTSPGQQLIGSSLAGIGFGAGLTAFHGIDRAIRKWDGDHNDKRDRSFEAAGSFIRGGNTMDKRANLSRHLHDYVQSVGARTPQAIATGLGYTGVSLATAGLLKHHKDLLVDTRHPHLEDGNDTKPNGPRVIIELGDAAPSQPESQMGGYMMSPRLASEDQFGVAKLASFTSFLKNVGGHPVALRNLESRINGETTSYRDEAAEALRHMDVNEAIHGHFGNLVHKGNEKDFAKELLDSKANELRRADIAQREAIKNDVARDRVRFGLGGLATLAGGAGIHHAVSAGKDDGHGH